MKSPLWTRLTTVVLLCLVAFAPAAMHARICFVALGAIESSECCAPTDCCTKPAPAAPTLGGRESDCGCCLDFDVDSGDRQLATAKVQSAAAWCALPSGELRFAASAPPQRAGGAVLFANAPVPRRSAAPIPLRI